MIKIEKNIPILPHGNSNGGVLDTMRKMSVGDSFVIPIAGRGNLSTYSVRAGIRVTARKINEKTIRVWRVA